MSTITPEFKSDDMRSCTVKVYSYAERRMTGTLCCLANGRVLRFSSLMELLLAMTEVMEDASMPQQSTIARSFGGGAADFSAAAVTDGPDALPLAIFRLKVMFRQNSSWQGSVLWLETGEEAFFRSVYELLLLMDSALSAR